MLVDKNSTKVPTICNIQWTKEVVVRSTRLAWMNRKRCAPPGTKYVPKIIYIVWCGILENFKGLSVLLNQIHVNWFKI